MCRNLYPESCTVRNYLDSCQTIIYGLQIKLLTLSPVIVIIMTKLLVNNNNNNNFHLLLKISYMYNTKDNT